MKTATATTETTKTALSAALFFICLDLYILARLCALSACVFVSFDQTISDSDGASNNSEGLFRQSFNNVAFRISVIDAYHGGLNLAHYAENGIFRR